MYYLYQQYGPEIISAILKAPGLDTDAVDEAFAALGRPERFDTVFGDWTLANWLDKTRTEARYQYPRLQLAVTARETLDSLPATYEGEVFQQAADYLEIAGTAAAGAWTVTFAGESTVPLIAARPHGGQGLWWSNRGDVSAPRLTRAFDLRGVSKATLSYWTWFDIEDGYDYAYTEVSTDGGQSWATLAGAATTTTNPNGNNLGHGYTAQSGGAETPEWVEEHLDLGPYTGHEILLRFQYVTDDGLNLQGFALDDIRIPEIGYTDDAETSGADGWQAEGFVEVAPDLPQRFLVSLITYAPDGTPTVTRVPLDAANQGTLALGAGGTQERAVLVVAPLAPATTVPAHYRVTVESP
jgi:hypothetical protein